MLFTVAVANTGSGVDAYDDTDSNDTAGAGAGPRELVLLLALVLFALVVHMLLAWVMIMITCPHAHQLCRGDIIVFKTCTQNP